MPTLHTVLHTFPSMPIRRICATIQSFLSRCSLPKFSWPKCLIQVRYCKEKLDVCHHHDLLRGFRTRIASCIFRQFFSPGWEPISFELLSLAILCFCHSLGAVLWQRGVCHHHDLLHGFRTQIFLVASSDNFFFLPWWEPISFELLSFAILCFCHSLGAVQ